MLTIAIINRKGGVGKSTACASIGGELARRGIPTLLADFDPQGTLTHALGVPPPAAGEGAAGLFGKACVPAAQLIVETRFPNLWLLPGSEALDVFNSPTDDTKEFVLRDFVADLAGLPFLRMLVDCAPNLYALSRAAMAAADHVLTPTVADPDGAEAIDYVARVLAGVQAGVNRALRHVGILLGDHYPRSAIHVTYAESLRDQWPGLVLDAVIPHASAFKESRKSKTPIGLFKPRSAAAKAVGLVVDEIESRMKLAYKEAA